MRLIHWSTMAKFRNRIKKSAKQSRIILANDYSNSTPKLEEKTITNIKTLGNYTVSYTHLTLTTIYSV